MTSTPVGTSKGKGRAPTDWRLRAIENVPTINQLAALRLPMNAMPEQKDTVPAEYARNVRFLLGPQDDAPWIGYFATWRGAKIAVTNIFGVWFEMRRRGEGFEAHRLARPDLDLLDFPLPGIDMTELRLTGEPITRPPSRAAMQHEEETIQVIDAPLLPPPSQPIAETFYAAHVRRAKERGVEPERFDDEGEEEAGHSSATNRPPRRPAGTGDDPMTLDALTAPRGEYLRLEGNPPDRFDGDRERTMRFLTQFRRFMLMNNDATIARDPIKKCSYFLSLMGGSKVDSWAERMYEWLDAIHDDPRLLMGRTAWQVMEREFKDAFTDYAKNQRAQDAMRELKMKDGNIDEYIAAFERLAHRAEVDPNDPSNLRLFAQGLPHPLVEVIIRNDNPETFQGWCNSAQKQQRNWIMIQSLKKNSGSPQKRSNEGQRQGNNSFGNFFWRRPGQGQGRSQQGQWRGNSQPARQRLPPRNDDAMDTSAAMRKATSEKEKEEYRKTGRCFECGKQGHLARACPSKRNKQISNNRTVEVADEDSDFNSDIFDQQDDPDVLATRAMKMSDKDKDAFIKKLQELGADAGFQEA